MVTELAVMAAGVSRDRRCVTIVAYMTDCLIVPAHAMIVVYTEAVRKLSGCQESVRLSEGWNRDI